MTNDIIDQFYTALSKYASENPAQRRGQATFNVMSYLYPDAAEVFRGGSNDPFYNDDTINDFISLCFEKIIESK